MSSLSSLCRRATASATLRSHARGLLRKAALDPAVRTAAQSDHLADALELVRCFAIRAFDESVCIALDLNVDAKQTAERVRGTVVLPHGTGKTVRVAVFARDEAAAIAERAGAAVVGDEELIKEVIDGRLDFDRAIATPDMLPLLAKAARTLGPRGLMPNPKRGTVFSADDLEAAVLRARGGEVQYKANKEAVVHMMVGKMSFGKEKLAENIIVGAAAVLDARPARYKSKPPTRMTVYSDQGPGVDLDYRLW